MLQRQMADLVQKHPELLQVATGIPLPDNYNPVPARTAQPEPKKPSAPVIIRRQGLPAS
jgi:hypothetical protein